MSDAYDLPGPTPDSPRGISLARGCCCASMLLALLVLAAAGGYNAWSMRKLKTHHALLLEDIAKARAAFDARRPVLFGPAVEGNAVDDYHAIQWALDTPDLPPNPFPGMSTPHYPRASLKLFSATHEQELLDYFDGKLPTEPPGLQSLRQSSSKLLLHVRDGLAKARCDWNLPYEDGLDMREPNLTAARYAANLMALEAHHAASGEVAVEWGLKILAFGRDFELLHSSTGAATSFAVKQSGYDSLARSMRRHTLSAKTYQRILDALQQQPAPDLRPHFEAERLGFQVTFAQLGGKPIGKSSGTPTGGFVLGFLLEREWAAGLEYTKRFAATRSLPAFERKPAVEAIQGELSNARYLLIPMFLNGSGTEQLLDSADMSEARKAMVRVLAAAHLHRLETGAFPATLAELQPLLGAIPTDPFQQGAPPLIYTLQPVQKVVSVRSWGPDGADDGTAGGDPTYTTQAPKGP